MMQNLELYKKFSIAISFGQITATELKEVLFKYHKSIHDVFFSPTESLLYQTRRNNYSFESTTDDQRKRDLFDVLSYAKQLGIACSMTLNASMVPLQEQVETFIRYKKNIEIDCLTTTSAIARKIRELGESVPITCSYNEAITDTQKLQGRIDSGLFNSIVLGGRFLRDINSFRYVKDHGISTILMLNTGCSENCTSFCRSKVHDYCINLFKKNLLHESVSELYARQSTFPEEIKFYENAGVIDVYKIASRPITQKELLLLLKSYTSLDSTKYIKQSSRNYHLYGRLAHYAPYYSEMDYDCIWGYKMKLWGQNTNSTRIN